ncbi:hypothetical protein [Rhodococcus erythropolis]|uniref:hypothetical protein n=1 Tax=Rhodococcus erythropolis TaxID=1833 RepID=UPI00366B5B4E
MPDRKGTADSPPCTSMLPLSSNTSNISGAPELVSVLSPQRQESHAAHYND